MTISIDFCMDSVLIVTVMHCPSPSLKSDVSTHLLLPVFAPNAGGLRVGKQTGSWNLERLLTNQSANR